MTPLPRWVFLAFLLGSAVGFQAHPESNACVPVCLAETRSTEVSGVCDKHRFVLQSVEERPGRFEHFFKLCLVPCGDPRSLEDPLVYVGSEDCRSFRKALLGLQGCSCDPGTDGDRWDPARSLRWLGRNTLESDDDEKPTEEILKSRYEGRSVDQFYHSKYLSDEIMHRVRGLYEELGGEAASRDNGQTESTVESKSSEENPVDWEMWCMAQCNHGQGGSACNCDLIP